MKKKPLNQMTRDEIRRAVLNHRFAKERKELDERPSKLGEQLYNELLTKAEQKKINDAPDGWFETTCQITVHVDGKHVYLNFGKSRRKPHSWQSGNSYGVNLSSGASPTGAAIVQYWKDKEAHHERYDAAYMAVGASLKPFKYVEDLVESWPEVKKFIPKDTVKEMTTALAFPPKQLNAMLGL